MSTLLGRLFGLRKVPLPEPAPVVELKPVVIPNGSTVIIKANVGGMTSGQRESFMVLVRGALKSAKEGSPESRFIVLPVTDDAQFSIEGMLVPAHA